MKFYEFMQNNSGGSFIVDDTVSQRVFIEAESSDEANDIAKDIGIYFNGVSNGCDCSCCGDRWSRASEYDSVWIPHSGINEYMTAFMKDTRSDYDIIIHYKDGNIQKYK